MGKGWYSGSPPQLCRGISYSASRNTTDELTLYKISLTVRIRRIVDGFLAQKKGLECTVLGHTCTQMRISNYQLNAVCKLIRLKA